MTLTPSQIESLARFDGWGKTSEIIQKLEA
jgi:hypothetical protein